MVASRIQRLSAVAAAIWAVAGVLPIASADKGAKLAMLEFEPEDVESVNEWEEALHGHVIAGVSPFSAPLDIENELKVFVPAPNNYDGCLPFRRPAVGQVVLLTSGISGQRTPGKCKLVDQIQNAQRAKAKGIIFSSEDQNFVSFPSSVNKTVDIFVLSVKKPVGDALYHHTVRHAQPVLVKMDYGSHEAGFITKALGNMLIFGLLGSTLVFGAWSRKPRPVAPQNEIALAQAPRFDENGQQQPAHEEHGHHDEEHGHATGGEFTASQTEFFQGRRVVESRREILLAQGWGSVALVVGTIFSLVVANSPVGEMYIEFWETPVGFGPPEWHLKLPVREWINEALMSFFFFVVGMEIKQELLFGSLTSLQQAALPCVAALGGMVVPAGLYCMVQVVTGNAYAGWAIPMATDIAFAMGVYNVFRTRMPSSVAAYLLTLATVDDLGAIAVIAIAFAGHINVTFLAGAGVVCLVLFLCCRFSVGSSAAYTLSGIALWYCMLRGGVNADIAGVVVGFAVPAISAPRHTRCPMPMPNLLSHYIHWWTGYSNFVIMPLFAVANTAVALSGSPVEVAASPISQGIMAGLILGKPLGIAGSSWIVLKLGWCKWPTGMTPIHLVISGLLGGIAFTMSLFLIEQSLVGAPVMFAKLAVILGSTLAAVLASVILLTMKSPSQTTKINSPGSVSFTSPMVGA